MIKAGKNKAQIIDHIVKTTKNIPEGLNAKLKSSK